MCQILLSYTVLYDFDMWLYTYYANQYDQRMWIMCIVTYENYIQQFTYDSRMNQGTYDNYTFLLLYVANLLEWTQYSQVND